MKETKTETRSIYRVTHRERGTVHHVAAESAQEACDSLGWLIAESHIFEVPKQRHPYRWSETGLFVKLLCEVCPYQRAECIKPVGTECPVRLEVPDMVTWLKKVLTAHNCDHVGVDLTINDYDLHRKWMPLPKAIKELTPKP